MATPRKPPLTPARNMRGTPSANHRVRGTPCRATPARLNGTSPRRSPKPIINNDQGEEGIQVAIRMRPLNKNESSTASVWKVLPKYNSVAQTTTEGKPLPERVMGRNFFSYDKTFGEEHDTKMVYDSVAKNIVTSVCTGLNGTIFAYGQTSSGKTYTMQGSGTIAEGQTAGSGGIVHMAAQDIFRHIESQPDRVFLVRASFLEIYNEEVRDLLCDNRSLQIREDPRRGVFVQSQEEIVKDFEGLLGILFQGEKSRAFASTAMNERSSRSHTIFRITIESRSKETADESNDENDDSDDGAVRVSTLNLVDLAGSESVRHTGATGDRQKEGGMINQSLLTLSRVIVALGTPNQTHINFRDSKLTRILQPSLSGNARMAVICCATPSQLYLEETRSTLLFASRAKLVKTNAQVNEVLDDRSIIRRLQKELALARRQGGGVAQTEHMKALEQRATQAGTEAKEANDKLRRLYNSLLNNTGGLFGVPAVKPDDRPIKRQRRFSEGDRSKLDKPETPERLIVDGVVPKSMPRPNTFQHLSPSTELSFLRQALSSKSDAMEKVIKQCDDASRLLQSKESELIAAMCSNELVKEDRDKATSRASDFASQIESMRSELEATKAEHESESRKKAIELSETLERLEKELEDRKVLENTVDVLQDEKAGLSSQLSTLEKNYKDEIVSLHEALERSRKDLEQATAMNLELQAANDKHTEEHTSLQQLYSEALQKIDTITHSNEAASIQFQKAISGLESERENLKNQLSSQTKLLEDCQRERDGELAQTKLVEQDLISTKEALKKVEDEKSLIEQHLSERTVLADELRKKLNSDRASYDSNVQDLQQQLDTIREEHEVAIKQLGESTSSLQHANDEKSLAIETLNEKLEKLSAELSEKTAMNDSAQAEISNLQAENHSLNEDLESIRATKSVLEVSLDSFKQTTTQFEQELGEVKIALESKEATIGNLELQLASTKDEGVSTIRNLQEEKDTLEQILAEKTTAVDGLNNQVEELSTKLHQTTDELKSSLELRTTLESEVERLNEEVISSSNARSDLHKELEEVKSEAARLEHDLSETKSQVIALQERMETVTSETTESIKKLEKERASLRQELSEKDLDVDFLQEEIEGLSDDLARATTTIDELKTELAAATDHSIMSRETLGAVEQSLDHMQCELQNLRKELEQANETISTKDSALKSLKEDIAARQEQQDKSANQWSSEKSELLNELDAKRTEIDQLSEKVEKLSEEMILAQASKERAGEEIAKLEKQLATACAAAQTSEATLAVFEKTKAEVSRLEQELAKKEEELKSGKDELLSIHDQLEQTNDKLNSLKVQLDDASDENDELKRLLMESNESVESSRESERIALENLATRSKQLQDCKEQLKALETKLKVQGERGTADADYQDSETNDQIKQQLEHEIEKLKQREEELRLSWETERRQLILDAEEEIQNHRSAAATAEEQSRRLEAEAYAAREMKESLEEQLKADTNRAIQLESRLSSLENENTRLRRAANRQDSERQSNSVNLQQVTMERDAAQSSLKRVESQLKLIQLKHSEETRLQNEKIERLQDKVDLCDSLEAKNNLLSVEADSLRQQNVDLEKKAREQEKRIKVLEKRKLTSDQVKQIKQMKDDLAQKTKELEQLKSAEPRHCNQATPSESTDASQDDELAKLRFDSEALDTQRRKLSKQCQLLQDEKLKSIKILRSSKLLLGNEDIPTAIVTLVDKLSSLEEELSSQTKALKHQNQIMEDKISEEQKKSESLRKTLQQQSSLLSSLENTKAEEQAASQYAESEIRTLKEENLRLGKELKATKKKLLEKKAELEMHRSIQPANESYLVGQSMHATGSTTKRVPSSTKRNRLPPLSSTKRDRNHHSASKENASNQKELPTPKRHRGDSEKRPERRAAGLGEAFEACEENTQECQQS